jgi:hypothetical protein
MMTDHRREEDLAELATGAAVGAERALALQHVVACGGCLQELAQLSRAADELLALAPDQEPPAGFESGVIARMTADAGHHDHPPRRRLLLSLAAALVAAAFGASAVWQATASDRQVADEQRTTLAVGGGTHFSALPIIAESGWRAGTVFFYEGEPSWVMVSLDHAPADGVYTTVVYDRDGTTYTGEPCEVLNGMGMDGYRLFKPIAAIASVELFGPNGVRLSAHA